MRDALHLWWRRCLLQRSVEELVASGMWQPQVLVATGASAPASIVSETLAAVGAGAAASTDACSQVQVEAHHQSLYLLEGGITQQAPRTTDALHQGRTADPRLSSASSHCSCCSTPGAVAGLHREEVVRTPTASSDPDTDGVRLRAALRAARAAEEASAEEAAQMASSEARAQNSESAALQECDELREQLRAAEAAAAAAAEAAALPRAEAEAQTRRPALRLTQDPAAVPAAAPRTALLSTEAAPNVEDLMVSPRSEDSLIGALGLQEDKQPEQKELDSDSAELPLLDALGEAAPKQALPITQQDSANDDVEPPPSRHDSRSESPVPGLADSEDGEGSIEPIDGDDLADLLG
mmetsp:Transcript_13178/g.30950  ORF Transcript_13178/g.30950 Transcript_13178/m.30950 type:complete len:352 (+) Transcript_13178:207-1262(+)